MQEMFSNIDLSRLPKHVAVIMDGNGRWAKERGEIRSLGHERGIPMVHDVSDIANKLGIKYLTLYAFSTENWNRPKFEVDMLMALIEATVEREIPCMLDNNMRMNVIGDMSRLPERTRKSLEKGMRVTAHCTGLVVNLAISYSSRWEIVEACRNIAIEVRDGKLKPEDINSDLFSAHLTTGGQPDPELLIRTAGDLRISNYLLWQIAYSELYFTPTYWPDFTPADFCEAIRVYQTRERRFGKTGDQIKEEKSQN